MFLTVIAFLLSICSAYADENSDGGTPLAIPASPPAQPQPLQLTRSSSQLMAVQQYQRQRLQIRGEMSFHGGHTTFYSGHRYRWGGVGMAVHSPVTTSRTWGVYQGPSRINVPDFLTMVGQTEQSRLLSAEIARAERASRAWYTTAGVGVAGMIVGWVGYNTATTRDDRITFNNISLGGLGLTVTGLIGGSFPAGKATRLQRVPQASMTSDQAQQLIDTHNNTLRESLQLSADDVWAIESQRGR